MANPIAHTPAIRGKAAKQLAQSMSKSASKLQLSKRAGAALAFIASVKKPKSRGLSSRVTRKR